MYDFIIYRNAWRYYLAPDREPQLSDSLCNEMLKKDGWMVRNTFSFDQKGPSDFWYIIKDTFEGLDELSSNVRRKIRRAEELFEYKKIEYQTIKDFGFPIIEATFKDYKVKDRSMNKEVFSDYLDYCAKGEFDYWGIFERGNQKLVGFSTVHLWENACEYEITAIWPEYLRNSSYPYYGLYQRMNEYYLSERKFKYVSDGSRSITEHSNIQPFLEQNFKFRKAYCKLKIHYKWWFGAIVRVLYPFRGLIWSRNVKAVLRMHRMQS